MDDSLPTIDPTVRQFWVTAIESHSNWLRASAVARLKDQHAVEDILQEVKLAAMRQTKTLPSVQQVTAWFASVLSRQTALWHRKHYRGQRAMDGLADREKVGQVERRTDGEPQSASLQQETMDRVEQAIRELPTPRKEIVLLKLVEGKTYQEISQQLGLTRHVVEYQFHQGRKVLRQQLVQWVKDS